MYSYANYEYGSHENSNFTTAPRHTQASRWVFSNFIHRDYEYPSQNSENSRNGGVNYDDSETLAYPESSQRTFISESSLMDAVNVDIAVPSFRNSRQHVSESLHNSDRIIDSSIYSSNNSCPDHVAARSQEMEEMVNVFCSEPAQLSKPEPTDSATSTFTFQLGPNSMNQIDDPELLGASDGYIEDSELREYPLDEAVIIPEVPKLDCGGILVQSHTPLQTPIADTKGSPDKKSLKARLPKRSKMHQCDICLKWFPRPSGLATHLNSHNGARRESFRFASATRVYLAVIAYECPLPSCDKRFAVRSNAKRHLRTHGVDITPDFRKSAVYTVGFETPVVSEVHEANQLPNILRWMPQSLTSLSMMSCSRPFDSESDGEDTYPLLPVPLLRSISPVSWSSQETSEEQVTSPYHPQNVSNLRLSLMGQKLT